MKSLQEFLAESISNNPVESWEIICGTLMKSIKKISKGNDPELVREFLDSLLMDWSDRWDEEPSNEDINELIDLIKKDKFDEYVDEWEGQINFEKLSSEIVKLLKI